MQKYRRKRKYVTPVANEEKPKKRVRYKRRAKTKKRSRGLSVCVFVLLAVAAVMVFTPAFDIDKIQVKGNSKVSAEDIIQAGRIFTGDNIWLFQRGRAEELIGDIPYIDTVEVARSFPNKIKVTVKESQPYGYVQMSKKYYLIVDRDGKILEKAVKLSENLKEIKLAKPSSTKEGESVISEGTFAGRSYKLILSQLKKNGYEDGTNKIQIKSDDIRFRFNELLVIIGDTEELDYKFAFLKTFLEERGDDVEGCFDISAPNVGGYYSENYDENAPLVVGQDESEEEEEQDEEEEQTQE